MEIKVRLYCNRTATVIPAITGTLSPPSKNQLQRFVSENFNDVCGFPVNKRALRAIPLQQRYVVFSYVNHGTKMLQWCWLSKEMIPIKIKSRGRGYKGLIKPSLKDANDDKSFDTLPGAGLCNIAAEILTTNGSERLQMFTASHGPFPFYNFSLNYKTFSLPLREKYNSHNF